MKKILLFLCFLTFLFPVYAGGGRIEINVLDRYGVANKQTVRVEAKISKSDYSGPSVGERAEFRLVNARPGDYCNTFNDRSDELGIIRGECGAAEAGGLTMYVHAFDADFDTYTVFFQMHEDTNQSPVIPTEAPSSPPTLILPVLSPTPSVQPSSLPSPTSLPSPLLEEKIEEVNIASIEKGPSTNDLITLVLILGLLSLVPILFFLMTVVRSTKAKRRCVLVIAIIITIVSLFLVLRKNNYENSFAELDVTGQQNESVISQIPSPEPSPSPEIEQPMLIPTPVPMPTPPTGITVTLKGVVYNDENCNYIFDANESPMPHAMVSIYQFEGEKISTLSQKTYQDDGKYSFSTTIPRNATIVLQPSPYRGGYSIITMSGLPQQVHLSASSRVVVQDLPMIDSKKTSLCH